MDSTGNPTTGQSRKGWLIVLLLVAAIALPLRVYFSRKPPPPDGPNGNDPQVQTNDVPPQPADEEPVWESEAFASAVADQLKVISKAIESGEAIDPAAIETILTDESASCGELRPHLLEEVFSDAFVTVKRGEPDPGKEAPRAEAFAKHLEQLTELLQGRPEIHVKFKVISVVEIDQGFETDVVYQGSGAGAKESAQQSAIWKCVWRPGDDAPPTLSSIRARQYEEAVAQAPTGRLFAECTDSVFRNDPDFVNQFGPGIDTWRTSTQSHYGVYPYGHHGIAIGDVNQDGLEDIYVCQPVGLPNRLFVQNADGTVTDMAPAMGVDWLDRSRGALLVDLDNDGDQDLAVAINEMLVILSFEDNKFTERSVFRPTGDPGSLVAADYDLDNDLDIYIVNYGQRFLSDGESSGPVPYHDANNGGTNALLRNNGDWNFTDVTVESGLDVNNRRWSFAAGWEDYDDDGDLDLYVANDFGRNNLYRNDDGKFADVAAEAGVEDIAAGMSVSWGDFDQDGKMDLYVGNMFSSAGLRIAFQDRFHQGADSKVREEFQRHARGNSLFRNLGNGKFEDVSESAGVTLGRWAWSSNFLDVNNDSWEDLVVANGFVTGSDTDDL